MVREPVVAGTFYPSSESECREALDRCFESRGALTVVDGRVVGAVVPHAGWMCSGRVAAAVFDAMATHRQPETVVIFGAAHRVRGVEAAVFATGRWDTPVGSVNIDERLADRVLGQTNLVTSDPYAHELEHSIEVQLPFLQRVWPEAKLLPIIVPPSANAVRVGQAVARTLSAYDCDAVVMASSDLTHYGRNYGFTPKGCGEDGLAWAKHVNDRRMIDLMLALDAEAIVPEASDHHNACGAGAIAAVVAASKALGADRGVLLEHTTSCEVLGQAIDGNAVGYAGVVFVGADNL
jgi:MEMO1 family protein